MRTLTLTKKSNHYVFRYADGNEPDMLEALADLAGDPSSGFDWMDAASISFQVASEQAESCLNAIAPKAM